MVNLKSLVLALENKNAELEMTLSEKVMVLTNKQAELQALCDNLDDLKVATEKKHASLDAELNARKSEVKNITQIKEEQIEKINVLDKNIANLDSANSNNEADIAILQKTDEKLTVAIEALQHTAAEDSEKLDELEIQCTDLSNQLLESEVALASTQEMERKCSREYIAYEKTIKKREAALANKGKGRFGS
eukprot:CAMPEP_0114363750 /NCGR_PEP_ID=MMETSP0101-20121206/26854_1 /TAXON_ID=38822 ORGANISM="Pteridomonas danica, Strain PT" /NCGR_SAMPLE_ID=MMETSP0101 /ASSEMBLY_ACC=CAM_ASM_000211 /LENGTH=190 /DNA_ID=CAMNT_0001510655 /DNA_START=32 /DNA_END=604 /DNA_ORIENTATION=-